MKQGNGPNGFIVIDKPSGITSFDVIRELRRQLKIKKLGHSGVLDKPATGVLVVGANRATRLFELFGGFEKEYLAELWFGLTTNTDDLSGELVNLGPGGEPTEQQIIAALDDYQGTIDQIPPAFSLTKIGGKELYRYALAGEEVEVKPKRVTIVASRLENFETGIPASEAAAGKEKLLAELDGDVKLSRARVVLTCIGGVYVRSLARDIGADLGLGGCLGKLVRTRIGSYLLEDALSLDDVARQISDGVDPAEMLLPLGSLAPEDAQLILDPTQLNMVRNGRSIRRFKHHLPPTAENEGDFIYGMDPGNDLAVILRVAGANENGLVELKPEKVLA